MTERAAHLAAIANAETTEEAENWRATWNAFQQDHAVDLKCERWGR
jgi:hypothetical protein